ncbi:MAG TPA: CpaF family protein [Abditibacteriaceae bacterium]|jgi:pilus assembly protein CpaF
MALFPGGGIRPRVNTTSTPAAPQAGNGPVLPSMDGVFKDGAAGALNGVANGSNGNSNGAAGGNSNSGNANSSNANSSNANGSTTNAEGTSGDYKAREMVMEVDTDDEDFDDEMLRLSHKVHTVLVDELGGQQFKADDRDRLRPIAQQVMNDMLKDEKPLMPRRKQALLELVLDEVLGFGPIQYLLNDPTISEVMVNSPVDIFIERKGKIKRSRRKFVDDRHVMNIIDRIVRPLGKQANARTPMVDGRLPDGSRVNIVIPPLALKGPGMSIRKFFKKKFDADDMIKFGSMTPEMKMFLEAAVKGRMNIIIAGGTGSGKTTTLNLTSNFIPQDERVVTVEDAAELQVNIPNLVTLESRPANIEGEGEVSIRDLVKNALRMRPDRIIVGECRGGETLDMLQAMNTGHDGSLSTVHSNTPRDTISRLETLSLMSGLDLPVRVISKQIASAVQIIVQQARLSDGSRKITHITEVQGMEGDTLLLQDIFLFDQKGRGADGKIIGRHVSTGFRPKCVGAIEAAGYPLPRDLFAPD